MPSLGRQPLSQKKNLGPIPSLCPTLRCDAGGQGQGQGDQEPHGSDVALAWQTGPLGDVGAQKEEEEEAEINLCRRSVAGVHQ